MNISNVNSMTAILLAAEHGHVKCAKLMIESGACVNAWDMSGNTSLALSIWNKNEELGTVLVDAGADVNGSFKSAACHWSENSEGCLEQLMKFGTEMGTIYLCYLSSKVAKNGNDKALKLLIEAGANVNTPIHNMYTLLMYTAYFGNTKSMYLFIEAGADVNFVSSKRARTALKWVAERGTHMLC